MRIRVWRMGRRREKGTMGEAMERGREEEFHRNLPFTDRNEREFISLV